MLSDLVVEGLGVIDRAELSLDRGCSALTGETGAGKTLVVAALSLLLGGRADRTLVRDGRSEARVEGRFVLRASDEAAELLRARGLIDDSDSDELEVLLSRTVGGGTGKVRVNGRLATVGLLAEVGPLLGEISGQHDHQRLSSPAFQRTLLDSFAGAGAVALAADVAGAVRTAREAERYAQELRAGERERTRELDVLAFEIRTIEGAEIRVGEGVELGERAARLEHAEAIARAIDEAIVALRGERGADELIGGARSAIGAVAADDPELGPLARRLEDAAYEIADVADELVARKVEPDPGTLEEVRERLGVIAGLRRKYGEDEAEILAYLDRSRRRARELESFDSDLQAAEAAATNGIKRATDLAERLGRERRDAAASLAEEVEALLEDLAIPGARFEVSLQPRTLSEGGLEDVEFLVAAGPGVELRPVSKIASGGELSRIALALHLVASASGAETMVFDEVDAGVGGEAAQAVGRALADLAVRSQAQVIVVTHLPQVAAFADSHFLVSKSLSEASVTRVDGDERLGELSRMLAGLPRSGRAREHARELLDFAAARAGAR
jgi:DNA repair protein RecN (Recombination protein N)